jgi:hypothetical protein
MSVKSTACKIREVELPVELAFASENIPGVVGAIG